VLRHLVRGHSRRQIAEALVVSESTVRAHLEHIYAKIGVSTKVGAVLFAMENGLTP
jgi:DNA-binding NarL/FixJ family response regulator